MQIPIPEWGPVSLIEILWTAFALIGMGLSFYSLRDAIGDRKKVLDVGVEKDDVLNILANGSVRVERVFFSIQSVFAFVGFMAMTLPNTGPSTDLPRFILALSLLGGEWGIAWNTLQNRLDRRRILSRSEVEVISSLTPATEGDK